MTAIENTFTLDVPSSTQNLALIREFVARVAAQAGLNETEVGQLPEGGYPQGPAADDEGEPVDVVRALGE